MKRSTGKIARTPFVVFAVGKICFMVGVLLDAFCVLLFFFFLLFSIQAERADNGRGEVERFADDAAKGEENEVISQPQGRTDERHATQDLILFATEGYGGNGHGNNGQNLQNQIQRGGLFAKDGEYGDIRKDVNDRQSNRPRGVVAADLVLINKDQRTNDSDEVENSPRERAQHKEVDHKQSRAKQLEGQDARLSLLLIGKNAEKHSKYANNLCNDFNRVHIKRLRTRF